VNIKLALANGMVQAKVAIEQGKGIPQGLKPMFILLHYGTTEVVP
jgi:hypothetical protein